MMNEPLALSRHKLMTFRTCRRRFQLRYLKQVPWPDIPLTSHDEIALARGQQFHQLLERYFLGLTSEAETIDDPELRHWWTAFQNNQPTLPPGRLLPELSLTVPVADHLLIGRFDLLVIGKNNAGQPYAHIFDWKTGKPRTEVELRQDWQTRLYFAMLAEGSDALWGDGPKLNPDNVTISYWYVTDPDRLRTIEYSQAQHAQNWNEIQALVGQVEEHLNKDEWPLTDSWEHCRTCIYQAYCDRQKVGALTVELDEDIESGEWEWLLEPDPP